MERLLVKLLLYNLIFINATAFLSDYNLDVIPEHYNLKLVPYFGQEGESFHFFGRCEVYVKIALPTYSISLHAQQPQIEILNTIVTNRESLKIYKPTDITYRNETHIHIFHFNYTLSEGHYLLNMSFIGFSDNHGNAFFRTYTHFNGDTRWFVATQLGAIGARQLFPCFDEPKFKATFNISVKHHTMYSVWSTMPIREKTVDKNDIVWTHFNITRSMPTYLISFLLYDTQSFPVIEYDKIYELVYHINTQFAKGIIQNVIRRFEIEWMEYSQNLSLTYHLITTAGPQHNSMGLILYRASNVFYVDDLDPVSIKIKVACLIAHEVARQWINNLVTPSWWSDFWLNEGIARLLGMDIINKIFQDSNFTSMLDLFAVQSKLESLQLDHYLLGIMDPLISKINKTSEIESLFSFSYYIKAPVILRMLRQHLSNEVFIHGIEMFLTKHMFSSITIDDFWSAMQAALNTTKLPQMFNVKEMMNTWTNQKHYPILKVEHHNCTFLRIWIENFDKLVHDDWLLPITIISIKWKENIKISTTRRYIYKKVQDDFLYIETDGFYCNDELVIIDLQQGYYRVNYEPQNWRNIARYLNFTNNTDSDINVQNRAQIIDDAFYFFSMHKLDMYSFLELIQFLSQETNFVVWYPMIKALESMSKSFPIYNPKEKTIFGHLGHFKGNMSKILNDVLERIGYVERSREDNLIKCLRQEVAKWACTLKHPKCLEMAKDNLEHYFFHYEKILPWWKEWTYCKGMQTETNLTGIWNIVLEKWMSDSDNRIWEFLTCIANPNSIKNYLSDTNLEVAVSVKNISLKFRNIDRVNRFLFTITKHAKNSEILDYILNNFNKLKPRGVSTGTALTILINNVYSEVHLQKITAFVEVAVQNILEWNMFFFGKFDMMVYKKVKQLVNQQIEVIYYKIQNRVNEIRFFTMTNH